MKKYLILLLIVSGFLVGVQNSNAAGSGYIKVLYPSISNVYWIKGQTYNINYNVRGWSTVTGSVYCDDHETTVSGLPGNGGIYDIEMRTWKFTVPTNWSDQAYCYVEIAGSAEVLPNEVQGVHYDTSDLSFRIVSPTPIVGKFQIEHYFNLRQTYSYGESFDLSFKVRKADGTYVTPTDSDIGAAVRINYANQYTHTASGPGVGGHATYNYTTGMWTWKSPTTLAVDDYNVEITVWCALVGGKCEWQYGTNAQVETKTNFSVVANSNGVPTVDLRANGQTDSVSVGYYNTMQLSWTSSNAVYCMASAYPLGNLWWQGTQAINQYQYTTPVITLPETLTLTCYNSQGQSASDSIKINVRDAYPSPYPTPVPPTYSPCSVWPRTEIINQNRIYSFGEICDGDLIRAQGDIAVYIVKISNGKYFIRRFFGPQIFKAYGHLSFAKVKNVAPSTLALFSNSPYLKLHGTSDVRLLADIIPGVSGRLYAVSSNGVDQDSIFIINDAEYRLYRR